MTTQIVCIISITRFPSRKTGDQYVALKVPQMLPSKVVDI